jgi:hypothetical protein
MREYLICYLAERNDVCADLETIVEAPNIKEALDDFLSNNIVKRVTSIYESTSEI